MIYTATTIGPIIETLNSARKTRELWGASYLFSYIIRKIVGKLKENNSQVILPYYESDIEWINSYGAGLFPDRIFVNGKVDVNKYFLEVISEISGDIEKWFTTQSKISRKLKINEIQSYFISYFRFIQVHFECDTTENIIDKGSTLLDSKELKTNIIPVDNFIGKENPLLYFLYHINGCFLFDEGFKNTKSRFPSLIEIALKEHDQRQEFEQLEHKIEQDQERFSDLEVEKQQGKNDNDILEFVTSIFQNEVNPSHKYIVIVQADGDNIGSMIAKIGSVVQDIQKFSQKLLEYSQKATEIVIRYGGSPIYMGGDDLFFIAPITYHADNKKTHILDMIKELDDDFNRRIKLYAESELGITEKLPSLSFGISFSYYKFPLYEAKSMAFKALFEDIKWADKKNAIKIMFRKHSGQTLELFLQKANPLLWESTIDFISKNLLLDANFINSFTHKLRLQDEVLFNDIAGDDDKLLYFFKNNFNENYAQQISYFESLLNFIKIIHNTVIINKDKPAYLYTVLRYIHFLRS